MLTARPSATTDGPLLCLPYTFELNDVPIWVVQGQSSDELLKRLEATLAVLEREVERRLLRPPSWQETQP
jgi:hypothetical protein